MTIEAKVIADSIGHKARRLTTFQLKYPRFIHAEFMTHRHFSRNASSSRAIPVEKQIAMIKADTAMPIHWGMNQSGMQADNETDAAIYIESALGEDGEMFLHEEGYCAEDAWINARDRAIEVAEAFVKAGYHKQVVNRILEPFSHIVVVVTSSQYDNFFSLRRHKDAQPEIKKLADLMHAAQKASTPNMLSQNEWHLPYVTERDRKNMEGNVHYYFDEEISINDCLIRASIARCARVSYLTHDGQMPSMENDLALYDRLVGMVPLHASPAEHQATPDNVIFDSAELRSYENPHLHGNLQGGWIQYRKTLAGECADEWVDTLNDFD